MKTILFLYHVSSIGGGSYCLLNILKAIDNKKYKPIVLLCKEGPLCDEIRKLDIRVYTLSSIWTVPYNSSLFKISSLYSIFSIFSSFRKYGYLLDLIKPDIVYVNSMMLYPYLILAKKKKLKTIIHIREHWPNDEHKMQRKIAINAIKKYADKIVAINHYSASMLESCGREVTVVYDWIDMSVRYKPIPLNELLHENCSFLKIYLYTGGLHAIKGIFEVVDTFSNYIKGDERRLLLMGVSTSIQYVGFKGKLKRVLSFLGYKSYSEKCIDMINKDGRIRCIPSTYYIKDLMDQAYCMVSYFKIPHANLALAEGIIEGTVSIAATTEEALEYSYDGELALLYKINSQDDFREKWLSLDECYDDVKEKIEEKRHLIKQMFDPERNAVVLNEVYERM